MSEKTDSVRFEVRSQEDDVRIVSLAFDIVLYTDRFLSRIPDAVKFAYERYLKLVPPSSLRWYQTESMSRHKPFTPRVAEMLPDWLAPGAPAREIISIEIRDGENFVDTADFSFFVYGAEAARVGHEFEANLIRLCFPAEWGQARHAELLQLAQELCVAFPFQSGHAGYVIQTTKYLQRESETQAWRLGMQFPAADIRNEVRDLIAVRDAIKGVGWLTIVSDVLLARIGGRDPLQSLASADVELLPVNGGVLLRAGAEPSVGSVDAGDDISAYRAVYRALEPLQRQARDNYGSFLVSGDDYVAKTERWLTRLADD